MPRHALGHRRESLRHVCWEKMETGKTSKRRFSAIRNGVERAPKAPYHESTLYTPFLPSCRNRRERQLPSDLWPPIFTLGLEVMITRVLRGGLLVDAPRGASQGNRVFLKVSFFEIRRVSRQNNEEGTFWQVTGGVTGSDNDERRHTTNGRETRNLESSV